MSKKQKPSKQTDKKAEKRPEMKTQVEGAALSAEDLEQVVGGAPGAGSLSAGPTSPNGRVANKAADALDGYIRG